jgi:hypothetical protein
MAAASGPVAQCARLIGTGAGMMAKPTCPGRNAARVFGDSIGLAEKFRARGALLNRDQMQVGSRQAPDQQRTTRADSNIRSRRLVAWAAPHPAPGRSG